MTTANASVRIDVRFVPPRDRHALIFATFDKLGADEAFELINDHDPMPLRHQFDVRFPGGFSWAYVESGPELWRVRITRVAVPATSTSCCGHCGGA